MSYGAPTKFETSTLQCEYQENAGGSAPFPQLFQTAQINNPGIFKQGGNYYFFCYILLTGEATGVGTKLYLQSNGLTIRIDGNTLYSITNYTYLADTYWKDEGYYLCNIGPTLHSIPIYVNLACESKNATDRQTAGTSYMIYIEPKQIQYLCDVVYVGGTTMSGVDSNVAAIVCLPEGIQRVKGHVIHIKSIEPSKKVIISSVDGTQIDTNTYNFTFSKTAVHSNTALTQINATTLVMDEGLAALSIVYDGASWRILSYYNGLPIGPYIGWGNLVSTTNTITERVVAVDMSTKTSDYLLNLPDPAGTLKEVMVIAYNRTSYSVGICRNGYSLDNDINQTLYLYPADSKGNACVRLLSNGTKWYVLSMFSCSGFTILTDVSTITPLTTIPPRPGIISLTQYGVVDTPSAVPEDGRSYLYHLKARFTSSSELVLTSKTYGGRICGSATARAIKSPAKLCPGLIFIDKIIGGVRYYYIVSFFGGY